METVIPGLLASTPKPLPFSHTAWARAFLLERDRGNLLIYSAGELGRELQAIGRRGQISRQYLTHHHEAEAFPDGLIGPLVVHEQAREPVAAKAPVDATYVDRHVLYDDFEVIPTPGHTDGSTCFLWHSDGGRVLFTGDTIFLNQGEWVAVVLEESDRAKYVESLELIRELDFDLLVPWIATASQPWYAVTDQSDARRRIDAILEQVTAGQNR
jgi:glyoxylase-like metal-dependent hydrolase (beta-lactamase superfamily II)